MRDRVSSSMPIPLSRTLRETYSCCPSLVASASEVSVIYRSNVEHDCPVGGLRYDGVAGIQGKVKQRLVNLIGVAEDHSIARFDFGFDRD